MTEVDHALPETDDAPTEQIVDSAEVEADSADRDTATDTEGGPAGRSADSTALLVQEGDIAADYLERLLDIVDYDGDIDLDVENARAIVAIIGPDLTPLVGQGGATLDALQELTRLAVTQKTGARSRLMLDIAGFRAGRRKELGELAIRVAEDVRRDGAAVSLDPMNPFERKIVHDMIGSLDGVHSESEGEEPNRRVLVLPGS